MKKARRVIKPSRVGSFGFSYKPALVEVSPGVVINREEVLGCVAGESVKQGSVLEPALLVRFKGHEIVPFFCPNPAEAAAKLCL